VRESSGSVEGTGEIKNAHKNNFKNMMSEMERGADG
jgi:hypothetical protein